MDGGVLACFLCVLCCMPDNQKVHDEVKKLRKAGSKH